MALSKVVNNSIESVDAAKLTGTLPAISGANLTNMAGGGAWTLINTAVASNSASLTITGLDSTYDTYAISIADLVPASDGPLVKFRVGDSSGVDTTSGDYNYHCSFVGETSASYTAENSASSDAVRFATLGVGNAAGEGVGAMIYITRPGDGTMWPTVTGTFTGVDGTPAMFGGTIHGARQAVITLDRVQVLFSSGNISTGRMTVWGISHT